MVLIHFLEAADAQAERMSPRQGAAVMRLVYALVLLAFAGAIAAAWQLWQAIDAVAAVRWGVVTLALLLVIVQLKLVLGQRLESDRLRREIKRLELQVALLREAR